MKTFQEFITEAKKSTIERNRKTKDDLKNKRPNIEAERGEFERYPHGSELMQKAHSAPVKKLSSSEASKLSNTDAPDIKPGAQGRRNVRRLAKKYGRDVNRVLKQVKSGTDEPSIVHKGELIAGNTRAMVRRSLNKPVKAVVIP